MAQRNIDFGTFPDDPDADAIRTAFQKVQQNFTELYSGTGSGVTSVIAGQGIQLGGTGSPTGTVTIEADIACIQVQSSTLSLGVLGSSSDESYVLIPSSSQILTIDLPPTLAFEDVEITGNLEVQGNTTLGNSVTANFFIGDGGLLSNLTVSGGSSIDNGTSNVVVDANGNVRTSVAGISNVLTVTSTGANVSGYMTATGNVTAGNFMGILANGTSNISIPVQNGNINLYSVGNIWLSAGNGERQYVFNNSLMVFYSTGTLNGRIGGAAGTFSVDAHGTNAAPSNLTLATLYQGYIRFATDTNERMRILSTGNVGIGTSTPTSNLHVIGTANVTGNARVGNIDATIGIFSGNVTANNLGNISSINLDSSNSNVLYGNGVFAPASGGNANTGNVTFDDVTVQGVNGLNLSAGADFTANLAYLQVRAGDVASHIHLDTGNNNAYDLIVGNDQKFVQVSSTGNILMSSYDGNVSYEWNLDNTGKLILAGGNSVIQSIANSSLDILNPNVSTLVFTPDANYASQSLVLDPTLNGHIHLRAPGANIDEPSANLFLGGETSSFEVGQFNGAVPNLFIHSGNNTWTFDNTGNVTIPGNTFAINYANGTQVSLAGGTSITNGTSNVVVDANSEVRTSVAGVANVLVVTSSGANVTGNLSVSGNTTLGNGSGGNITGANVISANTLIAALSANLGNSATANFFIGDGGLLSNIAGGSGTSITNGTSNVVVDANANVRISVAGASNVLTVTNTDLIVAGNIIPSTNLTFNLGNSNNRFNDLYLSGNTIYLGELVLTGESNDLSISGTLSALNASLGNLVSANFFQGDGGLLSNVTAGSPTSITNGSSNIQVDSSGNVRTSVAGTSNVFVVTGTGANIAGNLDLTGNVTANTISLTSASEGSISGANSISANFFIGDGSLLTNVGGLSGNTIFNGTSNVLVENSSNVTVSVAGNPNIMTATSTGVVVGGVLSVLGNSTTANIAATGIVTVTGNITGGNVLATTAMTAPRFISNVAQGTSPFVVTSNTIVSNLNANLLGGFPASSATQANTIVSRDSAGSIAANNITGNLVTAAQPNITSVGSLTSLTVTGNASAGNLSTAGRLSVTGNSNVGNLGASLVIVTGNLTATNANITSNAVANYMTVREDLSVVGNTVYGGGSGGNITGANVISANTLIAALSANLGNSATANFFIGDGGLLSNISGIGSGNSITNGTSSVVVDANSDVRTSVAGVANVLVVTSSGANVTGNTALTSLGVGTAASGTSGEIRATNNITAYYSSDRRLKENVQPITDPIEKVMQLSGVEFDWTSNYIKDHGGEDGYFVRKHDIGVIAQEVQKVLPEIVAERPDGMLAVKYEKMVALLIEAIKEQNAKIEKLEQTVAKLAGDK